MAYGGRLHGIGTVIARKKRYEDVPYDITVSSTGHRISGAGVITAGSIGDGMEIFEASSIDLELSSGETCSLVCSEMNVTGGGKQAIEVLTSGRIPGF